LNESTRGIFSPTAQSVKWKGKTLQTGRILVDSMAAYFDSI